MHLLPPLALLAAGLAGCAAASAPAAQVTPALPPISMEQVAPRAPVASPDSFSLSELPSARLPAHFDPDPGRAELAEDIDVITVWDKSRAVQAQVHVVKLRARSPRSQLTLVGSTSGDTTECSPRPSGTPSLMPLRWESVEPALDGAFTYARAEGWFDADACRPVAAARSSVPLRASLRGLVQAFRGCVEPCAAGERLNLILPRVASITEIGVGGEVAREDGAFTRLEISVRRGGGTSLILSLEPDAVQRWLSASRDAPTERAPASVTIGVDISQSVSEPDPLAAMYVLGR